MDPQLLSQATCTTLPVLAAMCPMPMSDPFHQPIRRPSHLSNLPLPCLPSVVLLLLFRVLDSTLHSETTILHSVLQVLSLTRSHLPLDSLGSLDLDLALLVVLSQCLSPLSTTDLPTTTFRPTTATVDPSSQATDPTTSQITTTSHQTATTASHRTTTTTMEGSPCLRDRVLT